MTLTSLLQTWNYFLSTKVPLAVIGLQWENNRTIIQSYLHIVICVYQIVNASTSEIQIESKSRYAFVYNDNIPNVARRLHYPFPFFLPPFVGLTLRLAERLSITE